MTDNRDRALGRVEGKIDLMIKDNNRIIDNQNRADIGRKQLYEAIEALRAEIADYRHQLKGLQEDVVALGKRVDELEKPVAELNRWRERAIGAAMLISIVAAIIGGALAASWQKIMDLFR